MKRHFANIHTEKVGIEDEGLAFSGCGHEKWERLKINEASRAEVGLSGRMRVPL